MVINKNLFPEYHAYPFTCSMFHNDETISSRFFFFFFFFVKDMLFSDACKSSLFLAGSAKGSQMMRQSHKDFFFSKMCYSPKQMHTGFNVKVTSLFLFSSTIT